MRIAPGAQRDELRRDPVHLDAQGPIDPLKHQIDIADLQDTRDLFAFDRLVLDPDGDGRVTRHLFHDRLQLLVIENKLTLRPGQSLGEVLRKDEFFGCARRRTQIRQRWQIAWLERRSRANPQAARCSIRYALAPCMVFLRQLRMRRTLRTNGRSMTTLLGRRVTVVLNGKTILDNREVPGITGGALDSNEGLPGPLMIQGDHGPISFRRITLTPAR